MKTTRSATRGRPRCFDADQALDCALEVFWRKGYEGASLPDLTRAMGINRPSLYAAFGNKRSLFRMAMDRYAAGPAGYVAAALRQPTARRAVEALFRGAVRLLADPRHPRGCLVVQGALACGSAGEAVRKELIERRAASEAAIRRRLERARAEGEFPADVRPEDLARYIATVLHGLSVQAVGGASRAALARVAALALRAWPA